MQVIQDGNSSTAGLKNSEVITDFVVKLWGCCWPKFERLLKVEFGSETVDNFT